jgi:hypothetical protein
VTTTYSITCSGNGGSATASATVSVNGHGPNKSGATISSGGRGA